MPAKRPGAVRPHRSAPVNFESCLWNGTAGSKARAAGASLPERDCGMEGSGTSVETSRRGGRASQRGGCRRGLQILPGISARRGRSYKGRGPASLLCLSGLLKLPQPRSLSFVALETQSPDHEPPWPCRLPSETLAEIGPTAISPIADGPSTSTAATIHEAPRCLLR
jgi:hypothetical protein